MPADYPWLMRSGGEPRVDGRPEFDDSLSWGVERDHGVQRRMAVPHAQRVSRLGRTTTAAHRGRLVAGVASAALKAQLGLRLERTKATTERIVIDHRTLTPRGPNTTARDRPDLPEDYRTSEGLS
jgi:hypothetical protein